MLLLALHRTEQGMDIPTLQKIIWCGHSNGYAGATLQSWEVMRNTEDPLEITRARYIMPTATAQLPSESQKAMKRERNTLDATWGKY